MRILRLRFFSATACIGVVAMSLASAADRAGTNTKANGAARPARDAAAESAAYAQEWIERPVPIRVDAKISRIVVEAGADGGSVVAAGTVSGTPVSCEESDNAVYCNTLGTVLIAPPAAAATARIADDIVTTAASAASGASFCDLDRFIIKVTGDKSQDPGCTGSGVGEYTVTYGLYESCPGANSSPVPIVGTSGQVQVPAAQACDIVEIEHVVPPTATVELPNQLYLAVSFSRANTGIVAGAPALRGFSADRYDGPSFPCGSGLGGFPAAPHASFYAEIYVRGQCQESFLGYRNSDHSRQGLTPDAGVWFADDIFLGVPQCRAVAYEVSSDGSAIFSVNLRTNLSDNDPEANVIPGTAGFVIPSGISEVNVGRVEIDPPVLLPSTFYIAFKTITSAGPILTCRDSDIGSTSNFYWFYDSNNNWWAPDLGDQLSCWHGFDVTVYCEGSPPIGACCDMLLTDNRTCIGGPNEGNACLSHADCRFCVGGLSEGSRCSDNFDCSEGRCPEEWKCVGESVCREVPEMNCASTLVAPTLWRERGRCGPVCVGGANDGEHCAVQEDCLPGCVNGPRDALLCCPGGGTCNDQTDLCEGGTMDGQECCPQGFCMTGTCAGSFCEGGSRNGQPCSRLADCPSGNCAGGDNPGRLCDTDDECPNSFCRRAECPGPFSRTCGISACCKPAAPNEAACENFTEKECRAVLPLDAPRIYARGSFCESYRCPITACQFREGECTVARRAFCVAGDDAGNGCDPFFNDCTGICLNELGNPTGDTCTGIGASCPVTQVCARLVCVGGDNDGQICHPDFPGLCPGGRCDQLICKGSPGCANPNCCTTVCEQPNMFYCCETHWDERCAATALSLCEGIAPVNAECFDPVNRKQAQLVDVPSTTEGDSIHGTENVPIDNPSDPGLCCNEGFSCPNGICARTCNGGPRDCLPCGTNNDCPPPFCSDQGRCVGSDNAGEPCIVDDDCTPTEASCSDDPKDLKCNGGERDGEPCDPDMGAGDQGLATVWYRFIAPGRLCPNGSCSDGTCVGGDRNGEPCDMTTSVRVSTCCSVSRDSGLARDSIIEVFSVSDPDRGLCPDRTPCSVSANDCAVGTCVFDEAAACAGLNVIACNDDHGGLCSCSGRPDAEGRSAVCVPDLIPGDPYYVMVAAKHAKKDCLGRPVALGMYKLNISSPCSQRPPPLHNDLCENAEKYTGGDTDPLVIPFDMSGESFGVCWDGSPCMVGGGGCPDGTTCSPQVEAPVTFDCPGPPQWCLPGDTMQNDAWFEWTAPCNGEATFETCGGSDSTTSHTALALYEGCGCPVEDTRILACDAFCPSPCFLGSCIRDLPVAADTCYQLRLGGRRGQTHDPETGEPVAGNLTISVTCDCSVPVDSVVFVDPPDGVVDARQPYPPSDPAQAQGIDTITVSAPPGAAAGDGLCWSLCETASTGTDNGIDQVTDNFDGTVTITLLRPITPGAVTTIIYTDFSGTQHTAGVLTSHPGNVDGSMAAVPADIQMMIDYLNGVDTPPFGLYSVDVDHSGRLAPADLLRLIDLHNGAEDFDPWSTTLLPDCGSCCP